MQRFRRAVKKLPTKLRRGSKFLDVHIPSDHALQDEIEGEKTVAVLTLAQKSRLQTLLYAAVQVMKVVIMLVWMDKLKKLLLIKLLEWKCYLLVYSNHLGMIIWI